MLNGQISMGTVRNLLKFSEMMREYDEDNSKTEYLMWHPLLSYQIERNVKQRGAYPDNKMGNFFESILNLINKNEKDKQLKKILLPALCGAIWRVRG
jgi:hypothetical protein